jgi:antitoxin ParD1/3/4
MKVSLTVELEKFVIAKVDSGRYSCASEVVREALRLLEAQDRARSVQFAGFNQELGRRLEALNRADHMPPTNSPAVLKSKSEQPQRGRA